MSERPLDSLYLESHMLYVPVAFVFKTIFFHLQAPTVQSWYIVLQRYIGGSRLIQPLIMVAADQLLFAPVSLGVFLLLLRGLEGKTAKECHDSIRRDWWKIYKAGLQVHFKKAFLVNFGSCRFGRCFNALTST